jgi:hypothetical protein
VIEGSRALPWLQRQLREDRSTVEYLTDCEKCMRDTPQEIRQALGCGWESRSELVNIAPWRHRGDSGAYTTCPGYTTKLPEVGEIAAARLHARLNLFRDNPSELLLQGITILEAADSEATNWREESTK